MRHPLIKYLAVIIIAGALTVLAIFAIMRARSSQENTTVLENGLTITTVSAAQEVSNRDASYRFNIPVSWYVEPDGTGAEIYPDYTPGISSSTASCKIALSVFDNPQNTDLHDWIVGYFAKDPTIVFKEQSADDILLNGISGIEWKGIIDGSTTTLIYVSSSGKIYEVAPSSLSSDGLVSHCIDYLEPFLKTMHFGL